MRRLHAVVANNDILSLYYARDTIMRLLDILEEAARATGLVKGSLFYSGTSGGAEVTKKPLLALRRRRQGDCLISHYTEYLVDEHAVFL